MCLFSFYIYLKDKKNATRELEKLVAFNPENIIDFKNDKIKSQNIYYLTKSDFKWVKAVNRKKYFT